MKIKLIYSFILLFYSLTIYSQTKEYGILGGEVSYEISSINSTTHSIKLKETIFLNPSKGYQFLGGFIIHNYPTALASSHNYSFVNKKVNCVEYDFSPIYWGKVPSINGVYVIESDTSIGILLGNPSINGWVFNMILHENRDTSSLNILNQTNPYLNHLEEPVIWARVYPFPNTALFHDKSVVFSNDAVIFAMAGDTISYNPGIADPDGDSLRVNWSYQFGGEAAFFAPYSNQWPIDSLPKPNPSFPNTASTFYFDSVNYAPGYDYNNPLPDQNFNPNNIPATLDTNNGEIYFCCHNPGNYSAAIIARSYRDTIIISETVRWIFFTIFPSDSNNTPKISDTGISFTDTIYAGDSVNIPFTISDLDNNDWLKFKPNGFLLDSSLIASTGCAKPPCAYFTTLPADSFQQSDSGVFHWQTSCNHLSEYQSSVNYNFVLNAKDNHCPINAIGRNSIKITVLKPPKLPPVILHCTNVDSLGKVSLSWSPNIDSTGFSFKRYNIWSANSVNSSFSLIDSIFDINQISYVHNNAGANSDTIYYFIETISSCKPFQSSFSDTISTIFLSLQNSGTGIADLSWNEIRDTSSMGSYYLIYRSIDGSNYLMIDSSLYIAYQDTVSVCFKEVSYFIALVDSSGCLSNSNICSDIFEDKISPFKVIIDTVSIASNHPVLSWLSSPSPDVVAYIIFRQGVAIDTISLSSFVDIYSDASTASYCYSIAAMDSCGNISDTSQAHCSIHLTAYANSCNKNIKLLWNINEDTLVQAVEVWASLNSGTEVLLQSLSASANSFVHSNAIPGANYCYFIREILSGNRSSSSNKVCLIADFSPQHDFAYLRIATVANVGEVQLKIYSDTLIALRYFIVERKKTNGNIFDSIGVLYWQASVNNFYFNDLSASTSKLSYLYRIITVDSCFTRDTTNIGQTIFLQTSEKDPATNLLTWNDYSDWNAGVDNYIIHRYIDNTEIIPPIIIPFSGAISNSFDDDVSSWEAEASLFCYSIVATENQGNTITLESDTSLSNMSCVHRQPLIIIPNAFTPGGKNPIFKPLIPYLNSQKYNMTIFNRWGEIIFESNDIDFGWNGTYKGKYVQSDIYTYKIRIIDNSGKEVVKLGSVMVLR